MPTARLPLNFDIQSRTNSTSKDSRVVNAIIEDDQIVKRPGLAEQTLTGDAITGTGQGIWAWNNAKIVVANNKIFSVVGSVSTQIGTLDGSTAYLPVSFSESNQDTYLLMHNGTTLSYIAKAAPTTVVNPLSGTGVISATIDNPGGNGYYSSVPVVTFSGGTPATGTAVVHNYQVTGITITAAGTYTAGVVPTITIAAPSPAGTTATGTCGSSYGGWALPSAPLNITSVVSGGSKYIEAPSVVFPTSPYGAGSTATGYTLINSSGVVTNIVISSGGSYPYPYSGSVTIAAPPNTTALATANMSGTISGPWARGIGYLDGSFYIMNKETGAIYGSGLNDPTAATGWNALNKIIAGSDWDEMVALIRHRNYIVAFGQVATEFFYDAANPSPGSPLDANKSAYMQIGCANGYSIAQLEQTVLWVGQTDAEGKSVYLLDGLQPVKVSTRYIDKYLNADAMIDSSVKAFCFKMSGHSLYVLTLKTSNITFVYDLDEKKWYQWTSWTGTAETFFTPTSFTGYVEYGEGLFMQDDSNGKIYKMSPDYYNDNGNSIYFRAVSPITDSGTTKRKFYQRVEVVGDKVSGNATIRHTSDDYQTWSTYRTVNLIDKRPIIRQLGEARRRAWEVLITDNVPVRLRAIEIDFDIGEQGQGQEG